MMLIIMDKEFKEYGRKMPYEVPEGFFADMQAQLLDAASRTAQDTAMASNCRTAQDTASAADSRTAQDSALTAKLNDAGESRASTIGTERQFKRRAWRWGLAGGIAAALVTALLLWDGKMERENAATMEYLYSYNNEMTDYEMIEIAEMIGNDIFLSLDME